jgi:hypothetical protein
VKPGLGNDCDNAGPCARPASHAAPEWVGPPGTPEGHGTAAANIVACAECHDALGTVCIACHRVGGVAGMRVVPSGSLHATWDRAWIQTNPACRLCHPG